MSWQSSLIHAITDPAELCTVLALDPTWVEGARRAAALFPLKVPREFVDRMQKGDRHDPLLLQVLPMIEETQEQPGYTTDPLNEKAVNPLPGLLHKYHGRVLLTVTGACAVHCRYCFRRSFPYHDNNPGSRGWPQAIDYIANDSSIQEVILSGGDPLVANDAMLQQLTQQLENIPHVKRLRIHTRLPIVIPDRITDSCLAWMTHTRLTPVVVIHCNHAQELNDTVHAAIKKMLKAGILVLNQTVLLKGVNDTVEALIQLSERLIELGVLPYYLHALDKVTGALHFDHPESHVQALHRAMMERLPGYCVPKLVREIPGALAKIMLPSITV